MVELLRKGAWKTRESGPVADLLRGASVTVPHRSDPSWQASTHYITVLLKTRQQNLQEKKAIDY